MGRLQHNDVETAFVLVVLTKKYWIACPYGKDLYRPESAVSRA